MKETLPGIFHWTTFHAGIGDTVHSYLVTATGIPFAVDPRVPQGGLRKIKSIATPRYLFLTNRLHYRHSGRFARTFQAEIWAHRAGRKAFGPRRHRVRLFEHGERLPGGIKALQVGALCPEETAFFIPAHGGVLSLGDAVIRQGRRLAFVPDFLMGDDPERVKRALRLSLGRLLRQKFDHLLLAHGQPWIGGAKYALSAFLGS